MRPGRISGKVYTQAAQAPYDESLIRVVAYCVILKLAVNIPKVGARGGGGGYGGWVLPVYR